MNAFNLTQWALNHRAVVLFLLILITVAGTLGFGKLGQHGSAGIRQAEQFGRLVKGLARRVIERFAHQLVFADTAHAHQLTMATRNEQGDEGKGWRPA